MKTFTLGELLSHLQRKDSNAIVTFGFAYFRPNLSIASERGDYSHLALGYTNNTNFDPRVLGLIELLEKSIGEMFTGWKGGEYRASEKTPIWVANSGEWCQTGIVDVLTDEVGNVILQTKHLG